jgi:hypothetical protein
MDEVLRFISDNKTIVAALITGLCTVLAALMRRDHKPGAPNPFLRHLLASVASLVVGGGLLGVEYFVYPLDPEGDLGLHNPGAILCLAGCVLVSAGFFWTIVNGLRVLFGRKRSAAFPDTPPNLPPFRPEPTPARSR